MPNCWVERLIWRDVPEWVRFTYCLSVGMKGSFMNWVTLCKVYKLKKGKEGIIWAASCWNIWLLRNEIIFRGDEWNVYDMVWNLRI